MKNDRENLYNLGVLAAQAGNHAEAAEHWERAADTAGGVWQAAFNLVMLYAHPERGCVNANKFIGELENLANRFNRGWAKVILGGIYCGFLEKNWQKSFSASDFAHLLDPKKGINLIEVGIPLAEEEKAPPLEHYDYTMAFNAFQNCKKLSKEGEQGYEGLRAHYLEQALYCMKKFHSIATDTPRLSALLENSERIIEAMEQELHALASMGEHTKGE